MKLYIGNKNYSSWSLRPWLAMRTAGIAFDEVALRIDFAAGSAFKRALVAVAPTGKVPVLVDDAPLEGMGPLAVWDTLAIGEYLARNSPTRRCGRLRCVTARAPARCAPKCTRASPRCARTCR